MKASKNTVKKHRNKAPKALTPAQILERCQRKEELVPVPALGSDFIVSVLVPEPKRACELKIMAENHLEFLTSIFEESLKGFTPEQVEEMRQIDGFKYTAIFEAVTPVISPFHKAMSEESLGKQKKG